MEQEVLLHHIALRGRQLVLQRQDLGLESHQRRRAVLLLRAMHARLLLGRRQRFARLGQLRPKALRLLVRRLPLPPLLRVCLLERRERRLGLGLGRRLLLRRRTRGRGLGLELLALRLEAALRLRQRLFRLGQLLVCLARALARPVQVGALLAQRDALLRRPHHLCLGLVLLFEERLPLGLLPKHHLLGLCIPLLLLGQPLLQRLRLPGQHTERLRRHRLLLDRLRQLHLHATPLAHHLLARRPLALQLLGERGHLPATLLQLRRQLLR